MLFVMLNIGVSISNLGSDVKSPRDNLPHFNYSLEVEEEKALEFWKGIYKAGKGDVVIHPLGRVRFLCIKPGVFKKCQEYSHSPS